MWTATSGWAAATSRTPATGMCWSFSPEMQQGRDERLHILHRDDPPAVIADGGGQAQQARRRRPGDRPAEAKADDPDLAALFRDFDRGRGVAQRLLEIELADDGHAARPRLRVVADVEPLLDMLEDGRRDREIAFRRKPVPVTSRMCALTPKIS